MTKGKITYKDRMNCKPLLDFFKPKKPDKKIEVCEKCGKLKIPFGTIVMGYDDQPCLCDSNIERFKKNNINKNNNLEEN